MAATDRIQCTISGCRRSRLNDDGYAGWICAKHWRKVPPRMRRGLALRKRRVRKLIRRHNKEISPVMRARLEGLIAKAIELENAHWHRCVAFLERPSEPEGLSAFLAETGL